jgi:hypothetical protein
MDAWEVKLEELVEVLKSSEKNLSEGRPPIREVVGKLLEKAVEEDLD